MSESELSLRWVWFKVKVEKLLLLAYEFRAFCLLSVACSFVINDVMYLGNWNRMKAVMRYIPFRIDFKKLDWPWFSSQAGYDWSSPMELLNTERIQKAQLLDYCGLSSFSGYTSWGWRGGVSSTGNSNWSAYTVTECNDTFREHIYANECSKVF